VHVEVRHAVAESEEVELSTAGSKVSIARQTVTSSCVERKQLVWVEIGQF